MPETDADLVNVIAEYDTIIAFSVTKWVHLNFADQGLKRFFQRLYRTLHPGGKLVLEPQPWPSYRIKRRMTVRRSRSLAPSDGQRTTSTIARSRRISRKPTAVLHSSPLNSYRICCRPKSASKHAQPLPHRTIPTKVNRKCPRVGHGLHRCVIVGFQRSMYLFIKPLTTEH